LEPDLVMSPEEDDAGDEHDPGWGEANSGETYGKAILHIIHCLTFLLNAV
jgi:hypothetical protein